MEPAKFLVFFLCAHVLPYLEAMQLASVRHTNGMIWSSLVFGTFSGAAEDIGQHGLGCVDVINVAARIKEVIGR